MPEQVIERVEPPGTKILDLRKIAPVERDFRVLQAFEAIRIRDDFCIISDYDPKQLKNQFDMEMKDRFEWNELKNGPDIWEVLIVKKGA
jgi:uncharacterized protein (DUF2249 family)